MKSYRGLPLWSIIFLCITFLIYLIAYFCFRGNGIISSGIGLTKADWLGFFGAYLGTAATVLLSIVAIKQNKSLNSLNEKLIKKELLDKVPFINLCAKENIFKPLQTQSPEVQQNILSQLSLLNLPDSPNLSMAPFVYVTVLANKRQVYFVFKGNSSEFRSGPPCFDAEVIAIAKSKDCYSLIRELELQNLSDEPALDIKLHLDKEYDMNMHLGPKDSIKYLFVLNKEINLSISLSYGTRDGQRYKQTCTYDILKNNGVWHGSPMSSPQLTDS